MASKPAFADASFFFALAARRDRTHTAAVSAFSRLLQTQRRIITTDYVIDEAITLTKARTNATVALALMERIEQSEAIVMEWMTSDRFEAAKAFFRKHADQDYSFTDCASFVLMREFEIIDALTTDRQFAEAGFRPLLPVF